MLISAEKRRESSSKRLIKFWPKLHKQIYLSVKPVGERSRTTKYVAAVVVAVVLSQPVLVGRLFARNTPIYALLNCSSSPGVDDTLKFYFKIPAIDLFDHETDKFA